MTDYSFKSSMKHTSLKEVFNNTKKGSRNNKAIIEEAKKSKNKPAGTIKKTWKISEKYEMSRYFEKTFSFCKLLFIPANLQNLHLQIINHKLKMNDQLKHFAKDENNDPVKGDCTFCKLNGVENPTEESYKHIFVECTSSRSALDPIANKNNIKIPDAENEGEKIIYFFPQEGKWNEVRTYIFYLIYKANINTTKLRKAIPNQEAFERYVKHETMKIAKANPSNYYGVVCWWT